MGVAGLLRLLSLTVVLGSVLLLLSGCLGGGRAPIYSPENDKKGTIRTAPGQGGRIGHKDRDRGQAKAVTAKPVPKNHYRVARGDTLYSIAWRFKKDYKQIAKWNRIKSPYLILPGQILRLIPPLSRYKSPGEKVVVKTVKPPPPKPVKIDKQASAKAKPKKDRVGTAQSKTKLTGKVKWQWPSRGKVMTSNTASGRNGIDIKGKMGQTVYAAAPGKVVYSGTGLVGYGRLIIIEHNSSFLSAYAHNSRILIEEGNKVLGGQPIAEMGNSGTNTVKLHFEIRKDGKPIDPRRYLPRN